MSKFCGKCGLQMQDDDFLCPRCGAIWGDRIYRVPQAQSPVYSDQEEVYAEEDDDPAEQSEQHPKAPRKKKTLRWLLPLAAVCLVLAVVLFLIGSDWKLWAGEGSSVPSSPVASTTTVPETCPILTVPLNLPYTVYTVKFVDPSGNPIPNVYIKNLCNITTSGYVPAYAAVSDKNGIATIIVFDNFSDDVYVNILSIPEGYDQSAVEQMFYYPDGQMAMVIKLKLSDDPTTQPTPSEPSSDTRALIAYTVQFVDTDGNPVSGVCIRFLYSVSSVEYLYSDADGMVMFYLDNEIDGVTIRGVPHGYSADLVGVKQYFEVGSYMMIVLDYAEDAEIDPPDTEPPATVYPLTISSPHYLYEPLDSDYEAGQIVSVKITYDKRKSCMLFVNGQEITDCILVADEYWEFSFVMPEEAVNLKLRLFYSDHLDEAGETMMCTYYRQNPDADETYLVYYYGKFGDAVVGILKIHSTDAYTMTEEVAGYSFVYPNRNTIQVLVNGQFMSLQQAYFEAYLTETDIKEIYDLHQLLEDNME